MELERMANKNEQLFERVSRGELPIIQVKANVDNGEHTLYEAIDPNFIIKVIDIEKEYYDKGTTKEEIVYRIKYSIDNDLYQLCLPHCKYTWYDKFNNPTLNYFQANQSSYNPETLTYIDRLWVMENDDWFEFMDPKTLEETITKVKANTELAFLDEKVNRLIKIVEEQSNQLARLASISEKLFDQITTLELQINHINLK